MNSYMVWVTKITYEQVCVGVAAENENELAEKAIELAKSREDLCQFDEPKYELSTIHKMN